jgi:hypothetical protein
MQYSISFNQDFAALVIKGLRKLPLEEIEGALGSFIKTLKEQEDMQAKNNEPESQEAVEAQLV